MWTFIKLIGIPHDFLSPVQVEFQRIHYEIERSVQSADTFTVSEIRTHKNMYVHLLYQALLTSQQDNLVFGAMNDASEGIACVLSNLVDTLQVIILSSMIFD